jgi:Fe-S-cluster-containing dehydrogenase component
MRCARCGGLMIQERFFCGEVWDGRKCVNCGECVDPVIEENRRFQGTRYRSRKDKRFGPELTPTGFARMSAGG